MKTNGYVTMWHLDEKSGEYTRKVYRARVFMEKRLAKSGIKQKGYYSGNRAVCRIQDTAMVQLGDYARCEKSNDLYPDRISDLKVTQITESKMGANPHTRLFLGRASERS